MEREKRMPEEKKQKQEYDVHKELHGDKPDNVESPMFLLIKS